MKNQGFSHLVDTEASSAMSAPSKMTRLPHVQVDDYDEREEATCIESAVLLRFDPV